MGSVKVFFAGKFADNDRVPATLRGRKVFYNPTTERYDVGGFDKPVYCSIEQFNDYESRGLIILPEENKKHEQKAHRLINGELDLSYRVHTKDGYHFKKEQLELDENDTEYFIPEDFKKYEQEAEMQDWQNKMTKNFKEVLQDTTNQEEAEIIDTDIVSEEKWEHIYDSVADIRNAFAPNDYY